MGDVERVVRGERKSCDSVDAIQPSCGEFAAPQNQTEATFLWRSTEISFDCSNVGEINASSRKNFKRVSRTIPVLCAMVLVNQDPFPSDSPTTPFGESKYSHSPVLRCVAYFHPRVRTGRPQWVGLHLPSQHVPNQSHRVSFP